MPMLVPLTAAAKQDVLNKIRHSADHSSSMTISPTASPIEQPPRPATTEAVAARSSTPTPSRGKTRPPRLTKRPHALSPTMAPIIAISGMKGLATPDATSSPDKAHTPSKAALPSPAVSLKSDSAPSPRPDEGPNYAMTRRRSSVNHNDHEAKKRQQAQQLLERVASHVMTPQGQSRVRQRFLTNSTDFVGESLKLIREDSQSFHGAGIAPTPEGGTRTG